MHKRLWSFILTACLLLALTPDTVMAATMVREPALIRDAAAPAETTAPAKQPKTVKKRPAAVLPDLEGSGTETDPYRIGNGAQLRVFADAVNGVNGAPNTGICAVLTQNINLSGICGSDAGSWTPIGTNAHPYKGTFDGGSFTVSGLYLQNPGSSYAGLFAANAGVIKNLGVAGGRVSAGNYAGGLCGINKGTITGCYSTAAVSGDRYTGGVCGYNDSGAILTVCYNTGTVNGSKYVGGICGYNQNTTSNCYNTGTVNGRSTSIGGICGYNKALVSGCYNTGGVCGGNSYVGSLCGYNHSGSTFVNCYYLITGAEKGNYGIAMTQQQFASGEVCWALNEGNGGSVVWKQTCGTGLPGFGGKTVYRTQTYNGGSTVFAYTNDNTKKASAPYTPASTNTSTETANENSGGHTSHAYQDPTWKWKNYDSAKVTFTCQDCGKELILEASVKKETTEPTCTKNGETVYTASVELDGTTFKEKKIVEKEKTAHKLEFIAENRTESCDKPKCEIACQMCSVCGKFFDQDGKKELSKAQIAQVGYQKPLPHTFDTPPAPPTWEWTPATYPSRPSATASFSCKKCNKSEKKTVTGKVSKKVDPDPKDCDSTGTITYTATVSFKGQNYTTEQTAEHTQTIPAKGHSLKFVPANPAEPNSKGYYICTRSSCGKKFSLGDVGSTPGVNSLKDDNDVTENELENDGTIEAETPTSDEPLPDGTEPPLPADSEEIPEETDIAPPPVEEPDQPDNPDNADTSDAPGEPDNSGGQDTSDSSGGQGNPDASDSSDGQGNPDASNSPEGADIPLVPDDPDTVNELNEANALENNIGLVSFRSNAAVKSMTQPTEEQQNIPLWGTAIVLMSLIGIVLLIVLRKKHN